MTDVPPPNGTTATRWRRRHLEHRLHLVVVGRADDGVGRVGEVAGAGPQQVGRRLAAGAQPTGLVVGVHVLGADDRGERRAARRRRRRGAGSVDRAVGVDPVVGDREDQLDQAAGGLGQRRRPRSGSPQRVGCISVELTCYSVTYDVTSSQRVADPQSAYLDAARACILDVGWRRTTLTEVARRAGVSRMTIYRAWPDMPAVLGDLMTREWGEVVARAVEAADAALPGEPTAADRLVAEVVATTRALRDNELFVRDRRARPRAAAALPADPPRPQPAGDRRADRRADRARGRPTAASAPADPVAMARALLLAAHGFVLSAHTMVDDEVSEDDLDAELEHGRTPGGRADEPRGRDPGRASTRRPSRRRRARRRARRHRRRRRPRRRRAAA